jgi:membrane protein YdbS with pleckstrin-like domain
MAAAGERPELVIKPKYVVSIVLLRTVFFYIFGAFFLSVAAIGVTSAFGGGDANFVVVISVAAAIWTVLYLVVVFGLVPAMYRASSYRFFADRLEYEAGTVMSIQSRCVIYARVIETGCTKNLLQIPHGMGNIMIKVAAAGASPEAQSTVLLDNLTMTDIEKADENLEKIRELIKLMNRTAR